jgi:hypothetical protein
MLNRLRRLRQRSHLEPPQSVAGSAGERMFLFYFRKERDARSAEAILTGSGYAVRVNEPDPQNVDWLLVAYGKTSLAPEAADVLLRRWTEDAGGEYGGSETRDENAEQQYRDHLERLRQQAAEVAGEDGGDRADLDELAEQADSREAFVRFLDALRADLRRELARPEEELAYGGGDWSHPQLEPFLETLGAWLTDSGRYDDLDAASWRAFAGILLAARVYE